MACMPLCMAFVAILSQQAGPMHGNLEPRHLVAAGSGSGADADHRKRRLLIHQR